MITKKVSKFGTGAHVVVAKKHIGKTATVFFKEKSDVLLDGEWHDSDEF